MKSQIAFNYFIGLFTQAGHCFHLWSLRLWCVPEAAPYYNSPLSLLCIVICDILGLAAEQRSSLMFIYFNICALRLSFRDWLYTTVSSSLSLTGSRSWRLIKREAGERLQYVHAGAGWLWHSSLQKGCGDPVTVNTAWQTLKTTLEFLIIKDSHNCSTLWLFFPQAVVTLPFLC